MTPARSAVRRRRLRAVAMRTIAVRAVAGWTVAVRTSVLQALAGAVLASAAAGVRAEPVAVRDERGVEHRYAAPPRRIVALLPSLTETVVALGGRERLVGVDRYSNWPADVAALPHLGGLDDAQVEAIVALRPDVVLASSASRAMDRLEALGVDVLRLRSQTHADVLSTLELVAVLLGTPAQGARAWAAIQRELDAAAARVPPGLRGRSVYFEIGGGPYAAGAGSFIGQTLARLGLENIVPREMGPFPKLNPEFVVRARPQIVMGALREQPGLVRRPGWDTLPALRERRLCGFEPAGYEMLIRPGPRMGEAALQVADCLATLGAR